MNESTETLRERVEHTYLFELTDDPTLMALISDGPMPRISPVEQFKMHFRNVAALRIALYDLAEQLDARLGGQVQPDE